MNVTTCGIDLVKNLFQVHGVSKPRLTVIVDRVLAAARDIPKD